MIAFGVLSVKFHSVIFVTEFLFCYRIILVLLFQIRYNIEKMLQERFFGCLLAN